MASPSLPGRGFLRCLPARIAKQRSFAALFMVGLLMPFFLRPANGIEPVQVEFAETGAGSDTVLSGRDVYLAQPGDTLPAVAARFRVDPAQIIVPGSAGTSGLLDPGTILYLPAGTVPPASQPLLPDGEVVYSPSAAGFDASAYLEKAGGYLATHREYLRSTGWTSAGEIVSRVALENSINPRLLLALLEYRCGCATGPLSAGVAADDLLRLDVPLRQGLYRQLGWAVNQLSLGYYGWRDGLLTEIYFPQDGARARLAPDWNAGSAALAYLFSRLLDEPAWRQAVDPQHGFAAVHQSLFGDAWVRERRFGPLFPAGLSQPALIFPFQPGRVWGYTSGPHKAWETEGALAALDFAPASEQWGCVRSDAWITAVADGLVVRSEYGALLLDLDGDGLEQTGWVILYLHVAARERAPAGAALRAGDPLGHPSCEGGRANGTHLHLARTYNGEWVEAAGQLPFEMDGWTVQPGLLPYQGFLVNGDRTIAANPNAPAGAYVIRAAAPGSDRRVVNRSGEE
jgi:murein DD-endopeptidase MepM/ murein hydrolase activator NlpD